MRRPMIFELEDKPKPDHQADAAKPGFCGSLKQLFANSIPLTARREPKYENVSFKNDWGEIRRKNVVGKINIDSKPGRRTLISVYSEWVLDDNWLLFKKESKEGESYHAIKASKRGNDVDNKRINKRLKNASDNLRQYAGDYEQTNMLYVTFTNDPLRYDWSVQDAWDDIGKQWNRFISALKKKYGKVLQVRSWEAHASGMPHIHAILVFPKKSFVVMERMEADKKGIMRKRFRIPLNEKDSIAESWGLGWVDVQAINPSNLVEQLENVMWYVGKNSKGDDYDYRLVEDWDYKKLLTESLLWYLNKRSFGITRELTKKCDLICPTKLIQTDLNGDQIEDATPDIVWTLLGMIRGRDMVEEIMQLEVIYKEPPEWADKVWMPHSKCHSGGGMFAGFGG